MWIAATLIAAMAQTMRNAAQADLTSRIGTMGATGVRFLFGLPFALLFLALVSLWQPLPAIPPRALAWTAVGAAARFAVAPTRANVQSVETVGAVAMLAILVTAIVTLYIGG